MKWWALLILFSQSAYGGSTIRAELNGKKVYWDNVLTVSAGKMVPSAWQHTSQLTPTLNWLPGGLEREGLSSIELSNGATTVTLPIQFLGFEYNTGAAAANKGSDWTGSVCSDNRRSGAMIMVTGGTQCFFDYRLVYANAVTPFTFIRPVFYIDKNDVISAFSGSEAGVYRGFTVLNSQYRYLHNKVESRRLLDHTFNVEIVHQPSTITQVSVSGDNQLTTQYDNTLQQVSGSTRFQITANGYFSQGLNVSLVNHRTDYLLKGPNLSEIPYSVDCIGCAIQSLVSEGKVNNIFTTVAGADVSTINFAVDVFFNNYDLTQLEEGQHSDTLTLIVEPAL